MKKYSYLVVFSFLCSGVLAHQSQDTLAFTSAEAEKISSLEKQVIALTMTLEGLQGKTELPEASQGSMAASLAEGKQRAEENKEAAASAMWKSRQNSAELDKFGNNWEFEEKQAEKNASLSEEVSTVKMNVTTVKEEVSTTGAKLQSEADRIDSEMSSQGQTTAIGIGLALLLLALASVALYRFTNSSAANTQKSVADDIEASKRPWQSS